MTAGDVEHTGWYFWVLEHSQGWTRLPKVIYPAQNIGYEAWGMDPIPRVLISIIRNSYPTSVSIPV